MLRRLESQCTGGSDGARESEEVKGGKREGGRINGMCNLPEMSLLVYMYMTTGGQERGREGGRGGGREGGRGEGREGEGREGEGREGGSEGVGETGEKERKEREIRAKKDGTQTK